MKTNEKNSSEDRETIEYGSQAKAGTYECTSCGYILQHESDGELPTCPEDDGHHAIQAWYPVESPEDFHSTLPNSPIDE